MNNKDNKHNIAIIINNYRTKYENSIKFNKGEYVSLGEYAKEENWPNWIWVENTKKQSGWAPVQIINFLDDKKGIILEDYSPKELNINKGTQVIKIKTLNGWTWVKNLSNDDEGWIPNEILSS